MPKINLPDDKDLAKTMVENDAAHTQKRLERGLIGWLLGDNQEKPGNVAGIISLLSFLTIFIIIVFGQDNSSF